MTKKEQNSRNSAECSQNFKTRRLKNRPNSEKVPIKIFYT